MCTVLIITTAAHIDIHINIYHIYRDYKIKKKKLKREKNLFNREGVRKTPFYEFHYAL